MSKEENEQQHNKAGPVRLIVLSSGNNVLGMTDVVNLEGNTCLTVSMPAMLETRVYEHQDEEDEVPETREATIIVSYQPYSYSNTVTIPIHAVESISDVHQSLGSKYAQWLEHNLSEEKDTDEEQDQEYEEVDQEQFMDDSVPDNATYH